jgi:puromycin-sensitive aminopeptidase
VISVARDARGLVISQRIFRYLQDGGDQERSWHVPIFLRAKGKDGIVNKTLLLSDRETSVAVPGLEWVVVNAGGHGYYRVRYSADLIAGLKQGLQVELSAAERFGLVNDTWASTLAGLTTLPDYLALIDLLRDESDINVWTTVIGSAHHLKRVLLDRQCASVEQRLRGVMRPALERLGWAPKPGEAALVSQLRGDLLGALGTVGEDPECQQRARDLYAQSENDPAGVDPNLIPALVGILAHTGNSAEYEKFYGKFKTAKTPQEETRYLFALAAFRKSELIDRTLKMTISGEVRTQNSPYLMRSILLNKEGRERAWSFMKAHWEEMTRQYPDNAIPRMCEGIIGLVSPALEKDARAFFAAHPVKQGMKQMEQHLERLRIAVACQERWREPLAK